MLNKKYKYYIKKPTRLASFHNKILFYISFIKQTVNKHKNKQTFKLNTCKAERNDSNTKNKKIKIYLFKTNL